MAYRAPLALFLLFSLSWPMPFDVLAEDSLALESETTNYESVAEEVPSEVIFIPDPPEEAAVAVFGAADEGADPEILFDCVVEENEDGKQSERCGLGYYRTLCGYNAGVEECVTFFELSEEPEPAPLSYDIERFRAREYITLHLSWNGAPLPTEGATVPFGRSGTLGWSYEVSLPEHHGLPYTYQSTYAELLAAATLTLQIYEGPIGEASLVYSEEVPHGGSGQVPFTFSESSEYRVILSATFSPDVSPPGYECWGELCPVFEPRIESLVWFMEHAAALYDEVHNEIDESNRFIEHTVQKTRMSTSIPLVSGMRELGTEETPQGVSSVIFLPGIKGSRLYRPTDSCDSNLALSCLGVKLWEPSGNVLLRDLFLNTAGSSSRDDIYVKENDIVSDVLGNNFYASFVNQMDALVADGTFPAWKPIAYDWRLSLDDLVDKGVKDGEKIYYQRDTETPYIEQSLKELAAVSPTGKVSIVAHSNGGLVAKRLMQRLEANGEAELVDQIIFVGVPQSGAPQAMAALLYGFGEALPFDQCSQSLFRGWLCSLLGSRDVARELAEHSPMAHHLLPSRAYFDLVQNPVASFTATSAYLEERNRYGTSIDSADELYDFLQAKDGGRTKPVAQDVSRANVLKGNFLSYARTTHDSLDTWVPPSGVRVHQIAGWGMNTIAGVEFYEQRRLLGGYKEMYRPIFVEDGDGVVPVPSALLTSSGLESVKNYWINLEQARTGIGKFDHANLFEISNVRILLRDILLGSANLPELITIVQPSSLENSEKLIFFLHSPLSLEIYDKDGNHVGENEDGDFDEEILNTEYGEFGDVKYIIAPPDEYDVVLRGKDSGTFSLDVQVVSGNNVTSSFTVAEIPTTASTIATISVSADLTQASALKVDRDGDGKDDFEIVPEQNAIAVYRPETALTSSLNKYSYSSRGEKESLPAVFSETAVTPADVAEELPRVIPRVTIQDRISETKNAKVFTQNELVLPAEKTAFNHTQTASAYDSVGSSLVSWLSSVLYNFWEHMMKIFTRLISKQ